MKSVLFLGKADDQRCNRALRFCRQYFTTKSYLGWWGAEFPINAAKWKGDYIISYLSRWVVPSDLLDKASIAAINFHSGPPEYPGIGCNNFALYDNATEYGVTCHHMLKTVDSGPIVNVKRFTVYPNDTVASLLERTYDYQLIQFYEIMEMMIKEVQLPVAAEHWSRLPYTRTEFEQLFELDTHMTQDEINRRTRAVTYKHWSPYYVKKETLPAAA